MSAWTQLIEPGPALLILFLAFTPQFGYAAPSSSENLDQSTEIEYYPVADATGCYYNFEHYDEGDRIITNEPCLNCTCHNRMLMCYLRVCPFTKAIGQDCRVEKKSDQCCPVITCPEVHVQLLPHASTTPSTQLGHPNEYGCTIDTLFYADGAKVPSNPNNPCEVCYCIRNKTACIIQECTLTGKVVEGCRPVYVDGVCCPVRYDCDHPEIETTPRPLLTTTTTTLPPTSAPTDCIYNNEAYADGALVKKDVPCEQCYCMRGDIVCAVQECGPTPLDKVNCTALPRKEGQCCPDTYECDNLSEEDLTTLSYYDVPTTLPTIIISDEGVPAIEDKGDATTAPAPQITLSDDQVSAETEGQVSESATETLRDHTVPEVTSITESVTSKISDAVEAVTSKVTEMIEAVTSTITGTKQESETTTIEAADKYEQITEKFPDKQQPVTEYEQQTDQGIVVTETIVKETQTPESEDQKLASTTPEKIDLILPVTTEIPVQDVATDSGEPLAHDEHESTEEEELPHKDENEGTENIPIGEQDSGITQSPELDTEDKHTRPIDQTEIEEKLHTTEESETEVTYSPTEVIPHEDEDQTIEGSGQREPVVTLAPQPDVGDRVQVTEQPEIKLTEEPDRTLPTTQLSVESETDITDISVEEHTKISSEESTAPITSLGTEKPGEEHVTSEYCSGEDCQQTVQPLIPLITTTKPESDISVVPETEITITEEPFHEDVTKLPEQSYVTGETETKLPKEVPTTENIISESVKPSQEEEQKETTTNVSSGQEPVSEEKEPSQEIQPPEESSITEITPTTEIQKSEVEMAHEEERPSFDVSEGDDDHITTEKDEIQFVTEVPITETKKPESMDHVFETISPESTSVKPDSDVHETEKPVEAQTTQKGIDTTELPKSSETVQPETIKPEEAVTELSENKTSEVVTENIPGITEIVTDTSVICDSEHGCAPEQEEKNEIPDIIETCTKESCAPQAQTPPKSESDKETTIPEIHISCDSEHDCAPTVEKEGAIETNKIPEEDISTQCDSEKGCPSSDSEGHIPEIPVTERCDSDVGCGLPVTETEIAQTTESDRVNEDSISEPCSSETGCISIIPGKEGEVPVTETEETNKLPEITTTSHEIGSTLPEKVTPLYEEGSGQPPTVSGPTVIPVDIEGSGQEIEGSGQELEDTQHTEGPSEDSGRISTKEPELITEEAITQTEKPSEQETTKETPSLSDVQPEKSTEEEQILAVTPITFDLENEVDSESTHGPAAGGTQSPETVTDQATQIPEITVQETESPEQVAPGGTIVPQDTATESEEPGVTDIPVPEKTQIPEKTESQGPYTTNVPEIISSTPEEEQNELSPEGTQTPHTEPEGTRSPYETQTNEQEVAKDTQAPERGITNVTEIPEKSSSEGTQYPENITPADTQLPEDVSKSTHAFEVTTNATHIESGLTEFPERISPEGTSEPETGITESTDSVEYASTESTKVPAGSIPEITEHPDQIATEITKSPEDIVSQTTHHIQDIPAGSTQIPEESVEGTQTTDEIREVTDEPQQVSPEGTLPSVDMGAGETDIPDSTQIPEQIIPESTSAPESEGITQSPVQISPEGTAAPEQVSSENTEAPEQEIRHSTQSPEEISGSTHVPDIILETSQSPDSKVPKIETTETSGQTLPESTEQATTAIPKFSETTQIPVQITSESEIEEEEHGIPGEGSCLVDGQTYKNNSNVPPINQCQTSCRCVSSILQCESVSCTPPPNNLQDCMPIFHSPDSCCPIYSCSVPGVTSMESDSHVVETTTVVQEEDKPVTIGIQIISSEEVTDKSSEVSIPSEETVTPKHIEEGTGTTESTEILTEKTKVPVVEATTPKSIEEETTKPEIAESITTQETLIPESETEKLPEVKTELPAVETVTKEIPVPESQTGVPSTESTDALTEAKDVTTTEPSAEPAKPIEGEQLPEKDDIENEIPETSISPEQCGVEGCQIPVLPAEEPQLPEKSVTEAGDEDIHTVTSTEKETTERHEESYTGKPSEEPITEVTESVKESELPSSQVPTAIEQTELPTTVHTIPSQETSTDKTLSESSTVTRQPEEETTAIETEEPRISDEVTVIPESSTDYTKLPEAVTESVTEPITVAKPSDGQHTYGTESSVTERIHEEVSTESEDIDKETQSPEAVAITPETEEAITSHTILPVSVTETMVEDTSPSEKQPDEVFTEQPIRTPEIDITTTEGAMTIVPQLGIRYPDRVVTTKPESSVEMTEPQETPEIRYPDRVTTGSPEYSAQTTELQGTIQTTSPTVEQITELGESITRQPIETADHVTEVAEEAPEKAVTSIVEVSSESTSKESIEEPVHVTDEIVTERVPDEESRPETESVTQSEFTTLPSIEVESAVTTSEKATPSSSELTTVSAAVSEVTETGPQETGTEKEGPISPFTEGGVTIEKEQEEPVTEKEKDITQPEEGEFPTHAPIDKETGADHLPSVTEKETVTFAYVTTETPTVETVKSETETVVPTEKSEEGMYTSPQLTTQAPSNVSELYTSGFEELSTKKYIEGELSTSATSSTATSTTEPSTIAPAYVPPPVPGHEIPGEQVPDMPDYQSPVDDYEDEDQSPLGPGTCRYGGKVYLSAQQILRDDPCDFCFCFRSDIICLQQSCPPPIPRCHEEPIIGFCCPRYECPVGMAAAINVTTSTTTTTTTLPPHFLPHAYKGRVTRSGCQIKGRAYQVGAEITSASGPCLHCTCGGDGEMKCDPKACSPEPMLRQMIAAAASRRRR